MNKRQAKKKMKKEWLKGQEELERIYGEDDLQCIRAECPYFDMAGIYGGGCYANNSFHCPLA